MKIITDRFDDHLTDAEMADRLARIDRLTAPLHGPYPAPSSAPGGISWTRPEPVWQSVLGLIGAGTIAVLTVLAFVVM